MSPKSRAISLVVATIAFSVDLARTAPQAGVDSTSVSATATVTSVSTVSVSTVVASPTASLSATLPSQVALPPHQAWCPSEIFCAGEVRRPYLGLSKYSHPKPVLRTDPPNRQPRTTLHRPKNIRRQTNPQLYPIRPVRLRLHQRHRLERHDHRRLRPQLRRHKLRRRGSRARGARSRLFVIQFHSCVFAECDGPGVECMGGRGEWVLVGFDQVDE